MAGSYTDEVYEVLAQRVENSMQADLDELADFVTADKLNPQHKIKIEQLLEVPAAGTLTDFLILWAKEWKKDGVHNAEDIQTSYQLFGPVLAIVRSPPSLEDKSQKKGKIDCKAEGQPPSKPKTKVTKLKLSKKSTKPKPKPNQAKPQPDNDKPGEDIGVQEAPWPKKSTLLKQEVESKPQQANDKPEEDIAALEAQLEAWATSTRQAEAAKDAALKAEREMGMRVSKLEDSLRKQLEQFRTFASEDKVPEELKQRWTKKGVHDIPSFTRGRLRRFQNGLDLMQSLRSRRPNEQEIQVIADYEAELLSPLS